MLGRADTEYPGSMLSFLPRFVWDSRMKGIVFPSLELGHLVKLGDL